MQADPNTSALVSLHALPGAAACCAVATYLLSRLRNNLHAHARIDSCCDRVLDEELFPVSNTMSGALVRFEPYAMRQLHWHVNFDEWCARARAMFLLPVHIAYSLHGIHSYVGINLDLVLQL